MSKSHFDLILLFVKEEIFILRRVIRPYIQDTLVLFLILILQLVQVLYYLCRSSDSISVIKQLILRCRPWSVL